MLQRNCFLLENTPMVVWFQSDGVSKFVYNKPFKNLLSKKTCQKPKQPIRQTSFLLNAKK